MANKQRFAVIGLGRFGHELATTLSADGAEVIAIDSNGKLIDEVRDEVTLAVRLDATDEDALRAQGLTDIDAAVVGIGHDFEAAALCVVVLKGLGVKHVVARVESDIQAQVLQRVGADAIVYPERESAQHWAHRLLLPNLQRYIELGPGHGLAYIAAPRTFHDHSLETLQLRQRFELNLVAIQRSSGGGGGAPAILMPRADTVILPGDVLILIGPDEALANVPRE